MAGEDRARAMAASVARTARSRGVGAPGLALLNRAHALAMGPRVEMLPDDRHPMLLHPGHTVLVLLHDVGLTDTDLLAAAALTESEDGELRIPGVRVRAEVGDEVGALVEAVPRAGADALAEVLVTAPLGVRLVALAERLDHLRHAHLREDLTWGWTAYQEATRVYLPVAERTHPRLADRYRYWCRTFAGKFPPPEGGFR